MSQVKTANYWEETVPARTDQPVPLTTDVDCDVCIVGAGYTGLWSAHLLKQAEPGLDIHVLESQTVGAGASGMNEGFVQMTAGKVLRRLLWYYGRDKAAGVYRSIGRSMMEIGRFCRKNGIDADFDKTGILQVVTDSKQLARLELQLSRADRLGMGAAFQLMDREEAQARIGSPEVLGGIKVNGALVNPLKLVLGIAAVVRSQGVQIHEQTPAAAIERVGDRFRVTTARGVVTARQVVVATNAWQDQFPDLANRQMPIWMYQMVTEPMSPQRLAQVAWPGREGVANSLSFSTAARQTPDGRVMWGGGLWYSFGYRDTGAHHVHNDEAYRLLRESFERFFPMWKDIPFTHQYGGLLSWSHSFIPQYGRTSSGLVYGHGCTGSGLAASHVGGKIIRDLVLGRDTEYTNLAYVTVTQPKFLPGRVGDKGGEFFIWRQKVGDALPLVLPHRAALSPTAFFRARTKAAAAAKAGGRPRTGAPGSPSASPSGLLSTSPNGTTGDPVGDPADAGAPLVRVAPAPESGPRD